MQVFLKLFQYAYIGRGMWLFKNQIDHFRGPSLEFFYSIMMDLLLGFIVLKDFIVFTLFIKKRCLLIRQHRYGEQREIKI
jgi:hypothetical protein